MKFEPHLFVSLEEEIKECGGCHKIKPFEDFSKATRSTTGRQSQCKDCNKDYRIKNSDKIKSYMESWRESNPSYDAKRYVENKVEMNLRKSIWYQENREKTNNNARRRRALKRDAKAFSPNNSYDILDSVFGGRFCLVCHSTEDIHLDHISPLSTGGRDSLLNFQYLCAHHNISKGAKFEDYRTQEQVGLIREYVASHSTSALVVPVMNNFKGFTELIFSVDQSIIPLVYNNWDNNTGVTLPWNDGINTATAQGYDYIFIANDDTMYDSGTMVKMMEALDFGFDLVSGINTRDLSVESERRYLEGSDFSSFLISPRTVSKFGLFDENIHSYFNDNDYTRRVSVGGGRCCTITDAGFYHVGSVTQFKGGEREADDRVVSHEQFRASEAYYVAKWGGTPGNEKYTTPFGKSHLTIKDW